MAGLTIRAYARHRGVSHTAVRKALAAGRITLSADGTIDPVAADRQWDASTDLAKPTNSVTGKTRKRHAAEAPADGLAFDQQDGSAHLLPAGAIPPAISSYAAARAAREAYLAELARLDVEERYGKLVDAEEVRAQVFALGRRLRDAFLGLPDRMSPLLVGQTDQAAVHRLLTEEVMTCLGELSAAPSPGAELSASTDSIEAQKAGGPA